MNRLLNYLVLSIAVITAMVLIKLWVVPFTLWHLFPQTDLVSRLYEVLIMAFGGVTLLLFIIQGYVGKHFFQLSRSSHLLLHFTIQLPFGLHAYIQEVSENPEMIGWTHSFAEGWCGLIAEPTRLMLLVYPWTDIFAIVASFVFLAIGRTIEIVDEDKLWQKQRNHVKVGRI